MAGIENSPILLVTVTKIEAMAVLRLCQEEAGTSELKRIVLDGKTYYDCGVIGGKYTYMVQSEMGTSTPGGALLTVHKAIESLKPSAVIMVGIAFGTRPDKQHLGDILVARQIQSYEPQKVKGRGKIIPRGDRVTCSITLLDKFRSGELDWDGASVHFGLVLSGEKLINDQVTRDKLLKFEPEAIGGEMEGAGLYVAAADTKTDWILVKAICDFADGNKNDQAQPLAARNAASFVFHVLGQGGLAEQSPESAHHHPNTSQGKAEIKPNPALDMAQRALDILEKQAAGYSSLSIPVHLQIELEDQRRKVNELRGLMPEKLPVNQSLLTAVATAPNASEWSLEQKKTAVDALLACPSISNRQTRDSIVNELPPNIRNAISRSEANRPDVTNILTTCRNYENGLQSLLDTIEFYEGDSFPSRELKRLLATS